MSKKGVYVGSGEVKQDQNKTELGKWGKTKLTRGKHG